MNTPAEREADDYPRFSDAEMAGRTEALNRAMAEREVEHVVLYGANRFGSAVQWLTGWPVTREALVVHSRAQRDRLLVNFYNHVPNARRLADRATVDWAGADAIETAIEELRRRGASGSTRVGVVGPIDHRGFNRLAGYASELVDMRTEYTRLRLLKSEEETNWTRIAARMTDEAVAAMAKAARPGVDERELSDAVERTYVPRGGSNHIHYFGATPMLEPSVCAPAQWPSARQLQAGDVLSCEVSASWWGYAAQLLRTFVIEAEPTPLYVELQAVADAAFDAIVSKLRAGATAAELVEASSVIEEAGFTIRDDLVHGFVGGYLPPILGSKSRALTAIPEFSFEAGMMVVVQPNVVTPDERAGVQTGELLRVTEEGFESMHRFERGLLRAG